MQSLWLHRDNVHGMRVGNFVGVKVWDAAFANFKAAYDKPSQDISDEVGPPQDNDSSRGRQNGVSAKQDGIQGLAM